MSEPQQKVKLVYSFQVRLFDVSNSKDPQELPDKLFLCYNAPFSDPESALELLMGQLKLDFKKQKVFMCRAEEVQNITPPL